MLRIERTLVGATGKLTVLTEPADAWVERDGERVLPEGTPVTLDGLPAGPLELTLGALRARDDPRGGGRAEGRGGHAGADTAGSIPHGTLTLELDPPDATVTLPDVPPSYQSGHASAGRRTPGDGSAGPATGRVTQAVTVSGDTHTRRSRWNWTRSRSRWRRPPRPPAVELPDTDQAYRPGAARCRSATTPSG